MAKGLKGKASSWMSKYIKLRDSIEYCKQRNIPLDSGIGQCCTCGKIVTVKLADAGHFISRGSRGASGVYFDERNCHFQCRSCNRFEQGRTLDYENFMLKKYGQEVIDELKFLDKNQSYKYKIVAIGLMYKELFLELKKEVEKKLR